MATTTELFGKYRVGERCWVDGNPHRISAVISQTYWDSDRIDDEDEFGREQGWYTAAEVEPDALTPEEAAEAARLAAEKQAERDAAAADRKKYEADLAAVTAAAKSLIAEHGLVPAPDGVTGLLRGTEKADLGYASMPGRGVSHDTAGAVYRDADWSVAGVSLGCPVDFGPRYWVTPALAAAGADKKRVWQWWNPTGYGAKTYPGPGVPVESLSPEERDEVEKLTAAAIAAVVQEETRLADLACRSHVEKLGLLKPDGWLLRSWEAERHPLSPSMLRSWEVRYSPEFLEYCDEYYHYLRARTGDRPHVRGVELVVTLAPAAHAKPSPRSKKPVPADAIRTPVRAHNFFELPVTVVKAEA